MLIKLEASERNKIFNLNSWQVEKGEEGGYIYIYIYIIQDASLCFFWKEIKLE
jgi:hypothetical protein